VDPERWTQVVRLFHEALELEPGARPAFLDRVCAGDLECRREIESLLASHEEAGDFIEVPAMAAIQAAGELSPEDRIGPYRIVRRIGEGGMGTVYLARRLDSDGADVAIKLIRPGMETDLIVRRFRRERNILANLHHPNIAGLLDAGTAEDGRPYLVMEYIDGRPLYEYCDREKLDTHRRLAIFRTICGAVDEAHRSGVIHRDLKPSNILVTADGSPHLLDFGISKLVATDRPHHITDVTMSAHRMMTPEYASPEQARGDELTRASDIYSLGVMLFGLLTGRPPYEFKSRSSLEMTLVICEAEPLAPSRAGSALAGEKRVRELDKIVLQTLRKEPSQRYESAAALGEDIERYLAGEKVMARGEPVLQRARKLLRQHRRAVSAAGLVLLIAGAAAVSLWISALRRVQPPAPVALRTSVALLDFRNLSEQPQAAWIATAFPEMLATELAAGEKLRVIGRESVVRMEADFGLAQSPAPANLDAAMLTRIHSNIGADYVVQGAYLALGDDDDSDVRLDLRLWKTSTGQNIASFTDTATRVELLRLVSRAGAVLRTDLGVPNVSGVNPAIARILAPADRDAARDYAAGLAKLRRTDALGARELLTKAAARAPDNPLIHSALAQAHAVLGYEEAARAEARRAFELAEALPPELRTFVEALYWDAARNWPKAVALYGKLWQTYPDNLDYGLRLAAAQTAGGNGKAALETIAPLRKLGGTPGNDARIDLAEAEAAESLADYKRQSSATEDAAGKAYLAGALLLKAHAAFLQAGAHSNQGDVARAAASYRTAAELYGQAGDRAGVARAGNGSSVLYWHQGRYTESVKAAEEALQVAREIGSKSLESAALNNLAVVARQTADYAKAAAILEQVLGIDREIGNRPREAVTFANLGNVRFAQGDLPAARQHYEAAIKLSRETGDKRVVGSTMSNLSVLLERQGEFRDAVSVARDSLNMERAIGNVRGTGLALQNLGSSLEAAGDLEGARQAYTEALEIRRKISDKRGMAYSIAGLATIAQLEGNAAEARRGEEEALRIRTEIGDKSSIVSSRLALVEIARVEGKQEESEGAARAILQDRRAAHDATGEVDAAIALAQTLLGSNKAREAENVLRGISPSVRQKQSRRSQLWLELVQARVAAALGRNGEAVTSLRNTLAVAQKIGFAHLELESDLSLAQIEQQPCAAARRRLGDFAERAAARHFELLARQARDSAGAKPCAQ
jgi:tetratricopeptide (TPR) repeat protein